MIYLKSFLVGIGMLILAVILFPVFTVIYFEIHSHYEAASMAALSTVNNGGGGFEMNSSWMNISMLDALVVGLLAFGGGFYWKFRRMARNSN